jgi:hypothetical protein
VKSLILIGGLMMGTMTQANVVSVEFKGCVRPAGVICAKVYSDLTKNIDYKGQEMRVTLVKSKLNPDNKLADKIKAAIAGGKQSLAMNVEAKVVRLQKIIGASEMQIAISGISEAGPKPRGVLPPGKAASASQNAVTNDREEISEVPGAFGVLHTENFEYVCKTYEGSDKAEIKMYLDVNFTKENQYRFAQGFANGAKLLGKYVALEGKVIEAASGRCGPVLCASLTLASEDPSLQPLKLMFQENAQTHVITLTSSEDKVGDAPVKCERNEVE